jgi:Ni,Fe-hydrogenase III small subunit
VDAYVAGCPPRPDEIIDGVIAVLGMFESGDGRKRARGKDPIRIERKPLAEVTT